jgi:hypothetical protein
VDVETGFVVDVDVETGFVVDVDVETGFVIDVDVETGFVVDVDVETGFVVDVDVDTGFVIDVDVETGFVVNVDVETGFVVDMDVEIGFFVDVDVETGFVVDMDVEIGFVVTGVDTVRATHHSPQPLPMSGRHTAVVEQQPPSHGMLGFPGAPLQRSLMGVQVAPALEPPGADNTPFGATQNEPQPRDGVTTQDPAQQPTYLTRGNPGAPAQRFPSGVHT